MSLTLYAHPFASYCWKTLIALYEMHTVYLSIGRGAPIGREVLWPIKNSALRDGDTTIVESSIIVDT
jgi:glutathione S-transferase